MISPTYTNRKVETCRLNRTNTNKNTSNFALNKSTSVESLSFGSTKKTSMFKSIKKFLKTTIQNYSDARWSKAVNKRAASIDRLFSDCEEKTVSKILLSERKGGRNLVEADITLKQRTGKTLGNEAEIHELYKIKKTGKELGSVYLCHSLPKKTTNVLYIQDIKGRKDYRGLFNNLLKIVPEKSIIDNEIHSVVGQPLEKSGFKLPPSSMYKYYGINVQQHYLKNGQSFSVTVITPDEIKAYLTKVVKDGSHVFKDTPKKLETLK